MEGIWNALKSTWFVMSGWIHQQNLTVMILATSALPLAASADMIAHGGKLAPGVERLHELKLTMRIRSVEPCA